MAADYCHNLGLIATGGLDKDVKLWNYERMKLEYEIKAHDRDVVIVKFVWPFPLLITADNTDTMFLWLTEIGESEAKCLLQLTNSFTNKDTLQITAVDSFWNESS